MFKPFDDVNGVIIGGNYGTCWVTYDGKIQRGVKHPRTEAEAEAMCRATVQMLKDECPDEGIFNLIYPKKDTWKFHFDGV